MSATRRRQLSTPRSSCSPLSRLAVEVEVAAGLLDVCGWTVRQWIANGSLKAIRIGRGKHRTHYRIPVAEIERFISENGNAEENGGPPMVGGPRPASAR